MFGLSAVQIVLATGIGIAIMLGVQRLARWDVARRERNRTWDGRGE